MKRRPTPVLAEALESRRMLNGVVVTNPVSYAVGAIPTSVAMGDFNGDGHPDLAVTNWGTNMSPSNTISILINNGSGTFQPQTTVAAGNRPYDVVAADLNGDGRTDLIAVDYGSNAVSVLLGNGNGTFTRTTYAVGANPTSVALGDLNSDGKVDMVVANFGAGSGSTLSFLLGNGNGTFQPQYTASVVAGPHNVAISDMNGDGKNDVIVSGAAANEIQVLLGTGSGTFSASFTKATAQIPESLAVADFNGDGIPDLAVAQNYSQGGISILLGNGNGTFRAASTLIIAGYSPNSVTAVDMNGDGVPDLAAVSINPEQNEVSVLLCNGNGTFAQPIVKQVGRSPTFVAAGDLNGDHFPDLAVSNLFDNSVSVLFNLPQFETLNNGVLDISGTVGNDTIVLSESANTVTATLNGVGNPGVSTSQITSIDVMGLAGNDSINIGSGVPGGVVIGGGGDDTILYNGGNATLTGGPGNDSITAATGNDEVLGMKNADTLVAGSGSDTLTGGNGFDSIIGGTGSSFLIGGPGGDTIVGHQGGNDFGIDTLLGGIGNDSLSGDPADSLNGGGQNDTVVS